MKRISLILTATLFIIATGLSARTPSDTTKIKANICGIEVMAGVIYSKTYPGTLQDFRALNTGSAMLKIDDLDNFYEFHRPVFNYIPAVSVMAGIRLPGDKRGNNNEGALLRLGLGYSYGNRFSFETRFTEKFTHDTLFNTQSVPIGHRDSVIWTIYDMSYLSDRIQLDISFVNDILDIRRLSITGGIGLSAGISVFAQTEIERFNRRCEETTIYPGQHSSGDFNTKYDTGRGSASGNVSATLYIPFGINYRPYSHKEPYTKWYIFYEARPGISFTNIHNTVNFTSAGFFHGLGCRWSF